MFEKGLNVPEVASISGHKTASQLFRYVQVKAKLWIFLNSFTFDLSEQSHKLLLFIDKLIEKSNTYKILDKLFDKNIYSYQTKGGNNA